VDKRIIWVYAFFAVSAAFLFALDQANGKTIGAGSALVLGVLGLASLISGLGSAATMLGRHTKKPLEGGSN